MALVYDPVTGRMVDDGRPINVGQAVGQAYLGAYTAVPAMALDAARRGVTRLVGGDPSTLAGGQDFYASRALGTMDQGVANFAEANASLGRNIQRGVLGLLGAQPAAPTQNPPREPSPPAAVAPTAPTAPTAPQPPAVPLLGQGEVNAINSQIAQSIGSLRPEGGIMQPAQRGVFNAQNATLRAPQTAGINFGFGVNGAPTAAQYLANMQVVDQQRAQRRQAALAGLEQQRAVDDLRDARTPLEIRQARRVLEATAPAARQESRGVTELGLQAQQTAGQRAIADVQNAGAMARTLAEGENRLLATDLSGQYGLAGRQAAADATLQAALAKNTSGTNVNAAAQAELRKLQLQLALDALQNGDLQTAASIVSGNGQPNRRIALDMLNNPVGTYDAAGNLIFYDEPQLARYRQASGLAQGR